MSQYMRTKKVRPAFSSRPASHYRATCILAICLAILVPLTSTADASCDMSGYKEGLGPRAELRDQGLQVSWSGEDKQQWRLTLGVVDGVPTIREMSARRPKGSWLVLARNARPEFQVTTGK